MHLLTQYSDLLQHIYDKMCSMFSTVGGWFVSLVAVAMTFLGDEQAAFYWVIAAVCWDMFWGIAVSIKKKRFILSYLMRETGVKLFVYLGTLFLVLGIERGISDSWGIASRVACALAAACEIWSSCASILIIKPNFPFIKFLKGALAGEIASKLKVDKDKINKTLKNE